MLHGSILRPKLLKTCLFLSCSISVRAASKRRSVSAYSVAIVWRSAPTCTRIARVIRRGYVRMLMRTATKQSLLFPPLLMCLR